MTQLDQLPADQRAVLSLVLRQGKAFSEVAALLRIDEDAVADRAYAALEHLGPPVELDVQLREQIGEYLLGQQSASARAATRTELEHSDAARAWARAVAAELRPLAPAGLPEIPAAAEEVDEAFEALDERTAAQEAQQRSSRVGGAMLLGALGVAVAAIVVFVIVGVGGGSSSSSSSVPASVASSSTTPASTTPGSSTTPAGTGPTGPTGAGGSGQVLGSVSLAAQQPGSHATGAAVFQRQSNQVGFALEAQGLAPTNGFAYAVWLYNSAGDAQALGFAGRVGSDGKLAPVAAFLPSNASRFKELVLTRETSTRPTRPGTLVLAGKLPSNL
jgi:hypothetical protein